MAGRKHPPLAKSLKRQPTIKPVMTVERLANEMRGRLTREISTLDDADVIAKFIACPDCGQVYISPEELCKILSWPEVRSLDDFLKIYLEIVAEREKHAHLIDDAQPQSQFLN